MAKSTKKAKQIEPASASPEHYRHAHALLRQRANALILDLAKRYLTSKAAELTTVLDAMDSLAEFERMQLPSSQ